LQYHAVFNITEVLEIQPEAGELQVVRQASYEDLAELSVDLIATS